jgi:hypothetical protein
LEQTGPLALEGLEHCLSIHVESRAHVGQREEGTAIDPRLAVDVDNTSTRASEIRKKSLFEGRIPVEDAVPRGIRCTQTRVSIRVFGSKPLRTVLRIGAVDDVGYASFVDESRRKKGTGANEDSGMEVGGRVPKIVWYRDQHCLVERLGF